VKPRQLLKMAAECRIELSLVQAEMMVTHALRMLEHNRHVNLTAITDPQEVMVKHIIDSLTPLSKSLPGVSLWDAPGNAVDIGSGPGYPGIPLAVARPEQTFVLVEATGRKAAFIQSVVTELGLDNVDVLHARAEEVGHDSAHRERHRLALARGVAELATLAEYLLPLVSVGGKAIAYKGPETNEELRAAASALETLGGGQVDQVKLALPGDGSERTLVYLVKERHTPMKFPRRPGMPAKRPIR